MSLHPISDKADIGSFGRHSQFDAYADDDSVGCCDLPKTAEAQKPQKKIEVKAT